MNIKSYSQKIIEASVELLKYDPMGSATYDQDQIEFDDDYYMDDGTFNVYVFKLLMQLGG